MSDNLPQPLPGAPALRAHLKALERGVADARSHRLGVPPPVKGGATHTSKPGMLGGVIGTPHAARQQASQYAMPRPSPAPTGNASGKPRAARAKTASDFGAFFDSIEKREAS